MSEPGLDNLLSQPLGEPADAGFSLAVVRALIEAERRRLLRDATLSLAGLVAILVLLPFTAAGGWVLRATSPLVHSETLLLVSAVAVLTGAFYRLLPDWG